MRKPRECPACGCTKTHGSDDEFIEFDCGCCYHRPSNSFDGDCMNITYKNMVALREERDGLQEECDVMSKQLRDAASTRSPAGGEMCPLCGQPMPCGCDSKPAQRAAPLPDAVVDAARKVWQAYADNDNYEPTIEKEMDNLVAALDALDAPPPAPAAEGETK